MAFRPSRTASAAAMAAALSLTATPATAAELPAITIGDAQVQTGDAGELNQYRYRRHRHRDRGVDAGDVIAGVVVLGALAAIIGSSRDHARDRERYEQRRYDVRYDPRERDRGYESSGIENAVDICIDQVEYRDNRVESVDRADRSTTGWYVTGALDSGERWTCWIDNGGEVRRIDYGEVNYSQAPAASSGAQLSDAAYARARASMRTPAHDVYSYGDEAVDYPTDEPMPAYPGGPLPGEEGYTEDWQVDGDLDGEWEGDGRYSTAQAPDFSQGAR